MNIAEKISQKIAEIRLQPEHVRMRWVWGSVIVSMLVIFAIWIFSITAMFQGQKNNSAQESAGVPDISKQLQDLKQQSPSLKDITNQSLQVGNEGVNPSQNSTEFQYPTKTGTNEIPQASGYSDLPTTTPVQ